MSLRKQSVNPNQNNISHARIVEDAQDNEDLEEVEVYTLEEILAKSNTEAPYLIKIDVDGAEDKVIRGLLPIIESCNVIIIEAQIRNFYQRSTPIIEAGFELFDVVDLCYHDNRLSQFDFVFINAATLDKLDLKIFSQGFKKDLWLPYRPSQFI